MSHEEWKKTNVKEDMPRVGGETSERWSSDQDTKARELLKQAKEAMAAGDIQAAQALLSQADKLLGYEAP